MYFPGWPLSTPLPAMPFLWNQLSAVVVENYKRKLALYEGSVFARSRHLISLTARPLKAYELPRLIHGNHFGWFLNEQLSAGENRRGSG